MQIPGDDQLREYVCLRDVSQSKFAFTQITVNMVFLKFEKNLK
jgi:hypothetical protein